MKVWECVKAQCEYFDQKNENCKDVNAPIQNISGCGIFDEAIKLEKTDDLTNEIMDLLRDTFNIDPDSDQDDELYTKVHNIVKERKK